MKERSTSTSRIPRRGRFEDLDVISFVAFKRRKKAKEWRSCRDLIEEDMNTLWPWVTLKPSLDDLDDLMK